MKRICLIDFNMCIRGGVEQVTAALVNELCKVYDVHLISLCGGDQLSYRIDKRATVHTFLPQELRLREMQRKIVPQLKKYFVQNNISVAIIQGNYAGFIVSPLRFFTKTKLVFCDHGALMNQWNQKDIVFIRWISSLLCHKVVTLTEQSKKDYIKKFHLSKKKVKCIYNWIDLEAPHSTAYNSESKRIISAGRFGKEKGFDLLVKAFTFVAPKHPNWSLDIFGDGEMMPVVKEMVQENGLENQVNLMGMKSDLAERYGDYAFYVLPSHREGMPLVLLEAKANKLPIVSFDIMTGPREIIQDKVSGLLVPPEDVKKLGEAMCQLIENIELRVSMSEHSQDNLNEFSKDEILKKWTTLIEESV